MQLNVPWIVMGESSFLPPLREYARLQREIVLLGMFNKIELWDQKRWKEKELQVSKNSEKISEALAELGL